MASDTKDERPVPKGYEVWRDDDGIWHPAARIDIQGCGYDERGEAIDACERHRLTVCRAAIEENGFARQISDWRNADAIRERDEARAEVAQARVDAAHTLRQRAEELEDHDPKRAPHNNACGRELRLMAIRIEGDCVPEFESTAALHKGLAEARAEVERLRKERDKARAMVTAEHEALFAEVERLRARVAELEARNSKLAAYADQFGDVDGEGYDP